MLSLKSFVAEKEACGYAKVIKKISIEKMDKCPRYLKPWVLRCPPKKKRRKKEMNKIAHVFLQSYFQFLKERYIFKEQGRIRLATIYTPYIHTHAHLDLIV